MKRKRVWSAVFFAATSVLSLGVIGGLWYIIDRGGSALPTLGQAPDFQAVNVDGKSVQFAKLDGKVRLVTWFYTHCPDTCPMTAYQMEQIQNQLIQKGQFGNQVVFVSINIDPKQDTLSVIRKWSEYFHPNYNGWYFVRSDPSATPQILKAWGIYTQQTNNPDIIAHTAKTELIDQNGNIRKIYDTANLEPNQVVSDIENLLGRGGPFGL
jgi:protein SCO1/2